MAAVGVGRKGDLHSMSVYLDSVLWVLTVLSKFERFVATAI